MTDTPPKFRNAVSEALDRAIAGLRPQFPSDQAEGLGALLAGITDFVAKAIAASVIESEDPVASAAKITKVFATSLPEVAMLQLGKMLASEMAAKLKG